MGLGRKRPFSLEGFLIRPRGCVRGCESAGMVGWRLVGGFWRGVSGLSS